MVKFCVYFLSVVLLNLVFLQSYPPSVQKNPGTQTIPKKHNPAIIHPEQLPLLPY